MTEAEFDTIESLLEKLKALDSTTYKTWQYRRPPQWDSTHEAHPHIPVPVLEMNRATPAGLSKNHIDLIRDLAILKDTIEEAIKRREEAANLPSGVQPMPADKLAERKARIEARNRERRESPKAVPPARRSSGFNIPEEVAA